MNSPFVDEGICFNMFKEFALASGFRQLIAAIEEKPAVLLKSFGGNASELSTNHPLSSIKHKINDILMMNCK